MEVIAGDRVLGCGQHRMWPTAGVIALKDAIEQVTAICKARSGGVVVRVHLTTGLRRGFACTPANLACSARWVLCYL